MAWLIIDLVIVAIVIFSAVISAKRGFMRSLIEVAGSMAVIYLCITLSGPVAETVYKNTIEPSVLSSVEEKIQTATEKTADTVWEALPGFVTGNSGLLGISKTTVSEKITPGEQNAEKIARSATDTVAKPVITRMLSLLISVVSIIVLLFVVKVLARTVNKLFSFSLLGVLNRFLGGLLGIAKGIIICVVFSLVVALIVSVTGNDFGIFTEDTIEKTYIFKVIYGALPFTK